MAKQLLARMTPGDIVSWTATSDGSNAKTVEISISTVLYVSTQDYVDMLEEAEKSD